MADRLESKKLEQELKALITTWRKSEKRLYLPAGSQADPRKPGVEFKLVGKLMSSPDAVAELGSILRALAPGYEAVKELRFRMSQEDFVITWNPYLAQDLKVLRQREVLVEQLYRLLHAIMLLLRLVPSEEQSEKEQEKEIFQAGMKLQERFKEQKMSSVHSSKRSSGVLT